MSTQHPDLHPAAPSADEAADPVEPGTPGVGDGLADPAADSGAAGGGAGAAGRVTSDPGESGADDPDGTDGVDDAGEADAEVPAGPAGAPGRPHAFLLYNAARLGMLVVAFGLFYVIGFRGLALLIVAFLVSGAVSYLALYRLRGEATSGLVSAYRKVNDRIEERARREDED